MLDVLVSGLVVSGNADITVQRQTVSGDFFTNQRVSGYTQGIYVRQGRTDGRGLTGSTFQEIDDYVDLDVYTNYRFSQVSGLGFNSGAVATVKRILDDIKITVYSGTFTNPAKPILISENMPQPLQQVAMGNQTWRFRNLL